MHSTTLMIANLLFFALCATAILLTGRSYGGIRGGLAFAGSNAVRALVMLFFLIAGGEETWAGTWLANSAVVLGFLLLHRAFAEVVGAGRRLWVVQVSVGVAGIALMLGLGFSGAPYGWFLAAMSGTMALILSLTAAMLVASCNHGSRRGAEYFTASLLIVYSLLNMARAVAALRGHADLGSGNQAMLIGVWLLASLVANGGTAFGFMLIASLRLARELETKAQTDELTGARNRHGLRALMEQIDKQGVTTVAAVSLDIDGMKAANDRWGHEYGDCILQAVAKRLFGSVQRAEQVVRLGGDEFVLVLPGVRMGEAVGLAEQLRAGIRELQVEPVERGAVLRGSLGVAEMRGGPGCWEDLLRRADRAMYRAKNEGRDRVCLDGEGTTASGMTAARRPRTRVLETVS